MKKPHLPLLPSELPPPPSEDVLALLPILAKEADYSPVFVEEGCPGAPADSPKTPPGDNGFLLMVEWPLRPGETRVEAYFIGTNRSRSHWFLWQFTHSDIVPFIPKYVGKRFIAVVGRAGLSKRDAAILLIKSAWEYERDNWFTPRFMFVSDDGFLDSTAAYEIADLVWGEED